MSNLRPEIFFVQYGTPLHEKVLNAVQQRYRMSREKFSDRHSKWAEQETISQAYVKPSENDQVRKQAKRDGKPQYTTIVIPYSQAQLLTMHTYWSSTFLSRSPIMQYEARHGEAQMNVKAVEALMDYQVNTGGWMVPLYIWLMDAGKYGLGVIGHHWADEYSITSETVEIDKTYFGIKTGKKVKQRNTVRIPGYSGNRVFNVRPQDFFPDPRVSVANFQQGEFCAHRTELGWNRVLKKQADGIYYNIEKVKESLSRWGMRVDGSPQLQMPDAMETFYATNRDDGTSQKRSCELVEMEIELVPREWGFGASSYPEKWVISVINDTVVVSVQPKGLYHNQFSYDVLEYEIEGYALAKRSVLEILEPLNDTLSWLFNSHMFNVRKVLNDQLVVDPSRVVMKDLTDPNAGRLIRLKPEAYGTNPAEAVNQLETADITRTHMQDAMMVVDLMQRITGASDSAMGMLSMGGRKTATEVRSSNSSSVNRMKTTCEYFSAMGFAPLGQKTLQTTQQKYDAEKQFKLAGNLLNKKMPMQVTPEMISGFYDFVPIDGTLPIDRFAQASLWKELFLVFKQFPQLSASYDLPGIMGLIAWLSGVKNFDQYRLEAASDGQVLNGVQAGNLVPIQGEGGVAGSGQGQIGGGVERDFTQLPQAGSIPGVGRAG